MLRVFAYVDTFAIFSHNNSNNNSSRNYMHATILLLCVKTLQLVLSICVYTIVGTDIRRLSDMSIIWFYRLRCHLFRGFLLQLRLDLCECVRANVCICYVISKGLISSSISSLQPNVQIFLFY
jgi:hypothetical protein